jgi:C-terminal processing protease CtpA/Prc
MVGNNSNKNSHSRNVYLQLANRLGATRLLTVNKSMPTEDSIYCVATVTISAPPGRLGIVIDTTNEGPLVYHVLDDSPLLNKLHPGDFIISMNDVDTRSMSSSQLSDIIRQTSESYRMLTVLREIIDVSKMEDT